MDLNSNTQSNTSSKNQVAYVIATTMTNFIIAQPSHVKTSVYVLLQQRMLHTEVSVCCIRSTKPQDEVGNS